MDGGSRMTRAAAVHPTFAPRCSLSLANCISGARNCSLPAKTFANFTKAPKDLLKHPLFTLDESERALVAEGFARCIDANDYTCYACAVMPDHVHLLIR